MHQEEQFSEEHLYRIALGLVPKVGPRIARRLIRQFGSAKAIFSSNSRKWQKINFNNKAILKRAERELEFCSRNNISVVFYDQPRFPRRLSFCSDAPYLLFVRGKAEMNPDRMISIVGTRRSTDYGRRITQALVSGLAGEGISIVSGLALGIDGHAHKACLANKVTTIGVVGHGLDRMSPSSHSGLAEKIIQENGAIVTEYLSGTPPDKYNFPSRNRIIAGMVDAVVVVESASRGGALITADIAHSYNRDVFAVPGKVTDRFSAGCNRIIKHQKALLIESGEELLYHMGWDEVAAAERSVKHRVRFPELTDNELVVLKFMQQLNRKAHCDEVNSGSGLPVAETRCLLLGLELKGVVRSLPGNCYELS